MVLVKNEDYEKLWLPDIFIDQAIDIRCCVCSICIANRKHLIQFDRFCYTRNPRYLIDPSSVRIYGDGMVSYAQRMNFDVTCNMDFRKFPFDNQTCDIIFHSFAYTTDDYTLRWMKKADGSVNSYTNHDIHLAQWSFDYSFDDEYDMAEIGDEVKPGLIATLTFQRLPFYHILMFYLPALLFSILAYLTSFIPPVYGIGLRSGVNIVILLSIFALNNGVKSSMPLVSYATFIDIWMFACFLVVFFALFEHSLLFIFISMRRVAAAKTIEVFSRFFIPIAFLLFVVVYIVLYFFL